MTPRRLHFPRRFVAAFATVALVASGLLVVVAGPANAATRDFAPVFTANVAGDVTIRGNTLETCLAGSTQAQTGGLTCAAAQTGGSQQNNNYFMTYVDTDGTTGIGTNTFDSSTATVTVPAGATVLYAGLSWGAATGAGSLLNYPALNGVSAPNAALRTSALFQTPGATNYATVTSTTTDITGSTFQSFANVTSAVQAAGSGVYTVANVQAGTGGGNYAGWSLAVAYSDPTLPARNLVIFTGYNTVSSSAPAVDILVSGFTTPATGAVKTTVGAVAYEGDKGSSGDSLSIGSTSLFNSLNPVNDVFNSSITDLNTAVTDRTPSYANTLGFDIDRFDATGALANGASSTTIHLTTSSDSYYPGMITFATDLYASALTATKTVTDVSGGNVNRGDVLSYSINVANSGGDGALATVLTDAVPLNTTYVAGSLTVGGSAVTDASGDDTGDVSTGNVTARLGVGANATTGGLLAPSASSTVTFRVTVNSVADGTTLSNTASFSSNAQTGGAGTAGASNTVTSTVVVPPALNSSVTLAASAEVGAAYSSGLTLNGGTGTGTIVWSISSGSLPAGLTINSSTGVISGTPTTTGAVTFSIRATDANNATATRSQTVTVVAGPSVTFAPAAGEATVTYSAQPTASGGTGPYTWSVSTGTLPDGLTMNSAGLISGTPTAAGTTAITVRAVDTNGARATSTASIVIKAAPTLTFAAPAAGELAVDYSDQLTFTGGVSPFTWSISTGALPTGLTLSPSTGLLAGTPSATGSFTFTVKIVDSNGVFDTKAATIVIAKTTTTVTLSAPASAHFGTSVTLSAATSPTSAGGTVTFTDVPTTGPQSGTTVTLGTDTLASGTASVHVALPAFGVNTITAHYSGDTTHAADTSTASVEVSAYAGEVIVSEFRSSGPLGQHDSYVELLNTGPTVPLAGLVVSFSSGTDATLPADAGFLGTGRSYLLTDEDFSLGSIATSDFSTTLGTGGIEVVAPDTANTQTDAVGPSSGYHLGTGLTPMSGTPTAEYAWVRRELAGAAVDTSDNSNDFVLVSRTGAQVGGVTSVVGSSSPTGTADPFQDNAGMQSTLLNTNVAVGAAPNRVIVAGNPGQLTVRRRITNTSTTTITAAKVRITALSELNGPPQPGATSQPAGIAYLRAINPVAPGVVVQPFIAWTNLTLDNPANTGVGGLNSTWTLPLPGGALAPGDFVNVAFTFAIDTHGTFWFGYDVDAIAGNTGNARHASRSAQASPRLTHKAKPGDSGRIR